MLNERTTETLSCQNAGPAFWHESQMPDQAGLILIQIPNFKEQKSRQMPWYARGNEAGGWGGGVLALTGTYLGIMSYSSRLGTPDVVSNWIVLSGVFFIEIVKNLISFVNKKVKIDMLSKQQQIARLSISFHRMYMLACSHMP